MLFVWTFCVGEMFAVARGTTGIITAKSEHEMRLFSTVLPISVIFECLEGRRQPHQRQLTFRVGEFVATFDFPKTFVLNIRKRNVYKIITFPPADIQAPAFDIRITVSAFLTIRMFSIGSNAHGTPNVSGSSQLKKRNKFNNGTGIKHANVTVNCWKYICRCSRIAHNGANVIIYMNENSKQRHPSDDVWRMGVGFHYVAWMCSAGIFI